MRVQGLDRGFIIVGENVHCTRVLLCKGRCVGQTPDGNEAVMWSDSEGQTRFLRIPEKTKQSSDYLGGRVKHVQIAIQAAMDGGRDAADGLGYINHIVKRQVETGVDFLDLNTDEIAPKHDRQREAMRWLVQTVQGMTDTPLSVDSSLVETMEAGMDAYDATISGRPLLNSASLERKDSLDLVMQHNAHVIITGAGERSMPENTEQRVNNASQMIDLALGKGIEIGDIQVDLLVFPVSVDSQFGLHYLNAVREIREKYGPEIHITGGMSNVSFGIPARRLVNDVFVNLAIENGADAGILDPVSRPIESIVALETGSSAYQLTRQMLLGEDQSCKAFLSAFRKGEL